MTFTKSALWLAWAKIGQFIEVLRDFLCRNGHGNNWTSASSPPCKHEGVSVCSRSLPSRALRVAADGGDTVEAREGPVVTWVSPEARVSEAGGVSAESCWPCFAATDPGGFFLPAS